MEQAEIKEFLTRLKGLAREGLDDPFRRRLRETLQQILDGQKDLDDLVGALRPLFRSVILSFLTKGNRRAALQALQIHRELPGVDDGDTNSNPR